jgi:uncharacterized protein (TIGR04255 family)
MKMVKPAVVFVVAAARFAQAPLPPLLDVARADALREEVEARLVPLGLVNIETTAAKQVSIVASGNSDFAVNQITATVITASDAERGIAVGIDPGGVSVRASGVAYQGHETLFACLEAALDAVSAFVGDVAYARIGFRYADLILPAEGRAPGEYLTGPFAVDMESSVVPESMRLDEHVQIIVLSHPPTPGRLVVKCYKSAGHVELPPDLQDPIVAQQRMTAPGGYALLDIDHFIEIADPAENLSSDALKAELPGLHTGIEGVFTSLLSEQAVSEWGVTT